MATIINCPYCGNKLEETEETGVLGEKYCQNCKKQCVPKVILAVEYYVEKVEDNKKEK